MSERGRNAEQTDRDGYAFREGELEWVLEHMDRMQSLARGNRIQLQMLATTLAIALVMYAIALLIGDDVIAGSPVVADFLYNLGGTLLASVIVVFMLDIQVDLKRRQTERYLRQLGEALRRQGQPVPATVLPDGAPHSVPTWVGLEGDRIAFLTAPGSRKGRNLERDPRVSISSTELERPNSMAHIRGRVAERLEGDAAWEVIDRLSDKDLGQPYPLREDRVVFLIDPEHAFAYNFG